MTSELWKDTGEAEMVCESDTGLSDLEAADEPASEAAVLAAARAAAVMGENFLWGAGGCLVTMLVALEDTTLAVLMTGPCFPASWVPLTSPGSGAASFLEDTAVLG